MPDSSARAVGSRGADPGHRGTVDVLTTVLGGMGLTGDELIHAARALRSAVHGFAVLEAAGGFGLAVDRDVSFRRLVEALAAGIA